MFCKQQQRESQMRIWKAKKKISYATSFFVSRNRSLLFFVTAKFQKRKCNSITFLRAPGVWNLLTYERNSKNGSPHDWFGPNTGHCARRFHNLRHGDYYMYNYCQQVLSLQPTTIYPASLFLRSSIRDVIHGSAHLDTMSTSASTVSLFRKHPYFLDEMLKSAIGLPV
jgi:hypothetical protein